ncbi:hypothetical protein QQZ08_004630 [Neonectria magnoliae]|uniref:F-box domain-containing protein n=1 Tax=Neonectria magnoliae TaxID=2732573 RepID=A0ABR1I5V7_9HYPO
MLQASLETFPNELLVYIAKLLSYHDLTQFGRTCKRLNTIVEPRIWTSIEFHNVSYHESSAELNDPPPFVPTTQRAYHSTTGGRRGQGQREKAEKLVKMLQEYHAMNRNRLQELCSRVKHLCTGVESMWGRGGDILVWYLLPYFTNLETLELHGDHVHDQSYEQAMEEIVRAPLPRLRFAKLFAYIPRGVARWVMKSGPTLERLEIGLLDRPISTSLSDNPYFKPLAEEKQNHDSDGDSDDGSDYGSLDGEAVIPRPLGGLLPDDFEPDLPRLKVIYLLSTADSPKEHGYPEYTWSSRAQKSSFSDWRRLLLASSETLETLVLELRPGADYIEGNGMSEQEYLRQNQDGSINRAIVRLIGKLLADKAAFPALQQVYLYGFAVGEDSKRRPSDTAHGGRLMLDLERRGVRCEARLGKWCFFDSDPGYVFWCKWDGDDGEQDENEDKDNEIDRWDTLLAQV